jgi:hypothetical protein
MENKTTIQTVKGTIFDTERAEGIAVFIPAGLVGIRLDAERFASSFGVMTDLHPKEMVVCSLPEPVSGITRHLVFFDNLKKKIETIEDMRRQVEDTLDALGALGAKTVAMNGIRSYTLPDRTSRQETYQRRFVEDYVEKHPGVFETIWLVDKRGGFDK